MIAQAGSATVEMALLAPEKAQSGNSVALNKDSTSDKSEEFQVFGNDGLTFFDFLDIINPLQHIPIISTLYRSITGDEIDPAAKIAGGTLYGGPIGAVASLVDVAIEYGTGKDIGEHALAMVQEQPTNAEVAANPQAQLSADAAHNPYLANSLLAKAGAPQLPNSASSYVASNFVLAQESVSQNTNKSYGNAAGMSAIPVARQSYADQIAAYMPDKPAKAAAPDLGMLSDIKHLEKAGIVSEQPKSEKPLDLKPRYSTQATKEQIKQAEAAYQKMAVANNNWLINSMMDGMNRMEKPDPGRSLDDLAPDTQKTAAAVH